MLLRAVGSLRGPWALKHLVQVDGVPNDVVHPVLSSTHVLNSRFLSIEVAHSQLVFECICVLSNRPLGVEAPVAESDVPVSPSSILGVVRLLPWEVRVDVASRTTLALANIQLLAVRSSLTWREVSGVEASVVESNVVVSASSIPDIVGPADLLSPGCVTNTVLDSS